MNAIQAPTLAPIATVPEPTLFPGQQAANTVGTALRNASQSISDVMTDPVTLEHIDHAVLDTCNPPHPFSRITIEQLKRHQNES